MPIPIIAGHGGLFLPVQASPETQRYRAAGSFERSAGAGDSSCLIHSRSHPLALSSQTVFTGVFYLIDDRFYIALFSSLLSRLTALACDST